VRIITIIQARLGSTRLPQKILLDLCGKPVIQRVYERACKIDKTDDVIVATTLSNSDDRLADFCRNNGIPLFRGSENDVLDRYYRAAKHFKADAVIRITGDCPLIDPAVVNLVVLTFRSAEVDYASNVQPPTYPDGLDTEIFTFSALETAWKYATGSYDREHVTPYIYNSGSFRLLNVPNGEDCSSERWTVD